MRLMDIYYSANNPIEDDKKLAKILEAYGNPNGLYAGLTTASSREYTSDDPFCGYMKANYNEKDRDIFYSKITNIWMNHIKNMSREEFIEKIGTRSFSNLRNNYIMHLGDVHSKREAEAVLNGEGQDESIKDALELYGWTYRDQKFWEHVSYTMISSGTKKIPKIDHRLYVNPDSEDLFEFMNYFVDKCEEKELPFYFKFCKEFSRDDAFVIYSSTDDLLDYVKILKSIQKEHPDLVSRFKEPPLLSGEIDNWIGYGSEPTLLNRKKVDYSFNSLREKRVLTPAIKNVTRDWLRDNKDKEINYRDRTITVKNLVSYMAVDDIVNTLKHYVKDKDTRKAVEENGICMYDLKDKRVLDDIYRIVDKHMGDSIDNYCSKGIDSVEKITLPLRDGKHFHFYGYQFDRVLTDLPRRIAKNDKKYVEDLRHDIRLRADEYKINPNKFYLDNYALREFQLTDYNNLRKENKNNHNWEVDRKKDLDKMFNVGKEIPLDINKKDLN